MSRHWLAFGLSFFVYLLPIVGPHAAWLLGVVLLQGWLSGAADKSLAWRVAELSVAVGLQAMAFAILRWALERPRRLLVFLAAVPAMEAVVLVLYLSVIPSYFLIQADTDPELNTLAGQCIVPNTSLLPVRKPADLPALVVKEWWLQYPDGRYGLMRAADCHVTMATWPRPMVQPGGRAEFLLGVQYFVPGAGTIVERLETATGARTWWLAERADAPMKPLHAPERQETPPVLSSDGLSVAWQQVIPGSGPPVLTRVLVRRVDDDRPAVTVDLTDLGPATYTVAALDTAARTATIWRNDALLVVEFDGRVASTYAMPADVRGQPSTFLVGPAAATLAWDAYQEHDSYRLVWTMTAGRGSFTLPKGRSFTDGALDTSRGLVALSATTTLSIGSTADLVAILRASDGRDVFRRYLPRYSRSPTIFFDGGLFGYSDPSGTHVIKLP